MSTATIYTLTGQFNGTSVTKTNKDIEKGLLSLQPDFLHTEMYVTVKGKGGETERKLNLVQGRKLFADPQFREVFINNLLLT
jgi:hypothetical protein